MDSKSTSIGINIPCPRHPSEFVQRVDMELNSSNQLYCLECILQHEDPSTLSSQLKPIKDLIDTAANFYAQNKDKAKPTSEVPPAYQELLTHQGEKLEQLSKQIEEEKKKAENVFYTLTQDFLKQIEEKKNEYLYTLDQQLFNLRYWYIFFDKQLRKAYPSVEDIPFLFPSKEDLTKKLSKITNATQLMAFVRNLKEDLNEQKLGFSLGKGLEESRKSHLQLISKELTEIENLKPHYETKEEISKIKEEMRNHLDDTLNKLLELENPIKDVLHTNNLSSKILKAEDLEMIKKWLPSKQSFNPKLLFRGTKDGMYGSTFHKLCDGKGATITLIKAQFQGSQKTCIIGGYLDEAWQSTGDYGRSKGAFLFSVTSKTKCPVQDTTYTSCFIGEQGPSFGGGHDLCVWVGGQSYVHPYSYTNTIKLIEKEGYTSGSGLVQFTPLEVEVYKI